MHRSALIWLALVMVFPFVKIHAQVKETIISERFVDNHHGWPEDMTSDFSASVCNGFYNLKYNKDLGSKSFDIPTKLYPGRNFFIETEGRILSGDKNNGFGIVWGKGNSGFFSFVITQKGTFYVREAKLGGHGGYLVKPTFSKQIRQGNAYNKIRVQYQQDEYVFFVNDNFVAHIPVERFYGDNAGLIIYGKQEVEVRSFGVYGTRKYESVSAEPTQLKVSGYAINDGIDNDGRKLGHGNSVMNRGDTILLALSLKNTGRNTAHSMFASITSDNPRIRVLESDKRIAIPTADPNEMVKVMFKFHIADDYNLGDIVFKVDITDKSGKLAETTSFKAPLNTIIPSIERKENNVTVTINFNDHSNDINASFPTTLNRGDNTCAVIIGVEKYQNLPEAKYAANDAVIFYNYLVKVLNVPRQNIILVTDNNATRTNISNIFKANGKLEHISLNKIDNVIFYFSGLGTVDPQSSAPYILASDSQMNNPQSGYLVADILKVFHNLRTKSTICFFETSFSGVTRTGEAFETNGGTFWNLPRLPMLSSSDNEMAVFYASAGEQCNPLYDATKHGLFTHLLLTNIRASALSRSTLNMKTLFANISREMMKECTQRGISVVPKLDCVNKELITILK